MTNTTITLKRLFSCSHRGLKRLALYGGLCTTLLTTRSNAAITFDWVKQTYANIDGGRAITIDKSGNIYTIGIFAATVDFDPGTGVDNQTATGSQDIFITKLDASGNYAWTKIIGGTGDESPRAVATDASGNVYISGSFLSTMVDFDPGSGSNILSLTGVRDGFLLKLDASGNFGWVKQFSGATADVTVHAVDLDGSGNIYVGGLFSATTDFNPGSGTATMTAGGTQFDAFITKLDASGNFVWAKQFIPDEYAAISSIKADASGNIYAYGCFENTIDCDPGSGIKEFTSRGLMDLFVLKLDANGNFGWAAHAGGTEPDWPRSMDIDASGNAYVTGTFDGNADFDPEGSGYVLHSVGTFPNPDVFLLKVSNTGAFGWVKQFGSSFPDGGGGVTLDADGNIYTTGSFNELMDADPGGTATYLTSLGEDVFISKLDPSGNYVWAGSMAGKRASYSFSRSNSIALDPSGNIYTTGNINDTVDVDPGSGTYNIRSVDGPYFIHKMTNTSVSVRETATADMTVFPNPATGLVQITTAQPMVNASLRITDMAGKLVLKQNSISGPACQVNINGLVSGLYLLEIADGNQVYRTNISRK